jgi:FkbM family methyltransferase
LYFKRLFPDCRIIAYEPDPDIFQLLSENVKNSNLQNVELRQAGVWVEDTDLVFYSEGSLACSSMVDFISAGNTKKIRAERLRPVLQRHKIDFLKIDIEGAENRVLFDIESELENISHLFFEYHGQSRDEQLLGEMLQLVKRAGFRYVINGCHAPQYPFIQRINKGFDLQLNVSCYRP